MMKKMLFLMLFLMILGAANLSAQVRIGGNEKPNDAAVLDLNADNDTNAGTKGLALPRVRLSDKTAKLDGVTANIKGMLVYNTGGSLAEGVYYWNGTTWVNTPGSYILGRDSLVGLDNARTGDVLRYDGSVWSPAPDLELQGWTESCTQCATVGTTGSTVYVSPTWPARCSHLNSWIDSRSSSAIWAVNLGIDNRLGYNRISNTASTAIPVCKVYCLRTTR